MQNITTFYFTVFSMNIFFVVLLSLHFSLLTCQLTGYGGVYHAPPGVEYWDGDTIDASIRASKIGRMLIEKLMKRKVYFPGAEQTKTIEGSRHFAGHFPPQTEATNPKIFPDKQNTKQLRKQYEPNDQIHTFGHGSLYPNFDSRHEYFKERNEISNGQARSIFNQCLTCDFSDEGNFFQTHHTHTIRHGHGVVSNVEVYRQFRVI